VQCSERERLESALAEMVSRLVYRALSGGRIRRILFDELPVGLGGIP